MVGIEAVYGEADIDVLELIRLWLPILVGSLPIAIVKVVHEARLEQSTNSDEEWVDSQVVCQYLRICEKTLQRLRAAGKVAYSCVGNKYCYQIAEIKRCLKAHIIKSSDEMLDDLIQRSGYTPRR